MLDQFKVLDPLELQLEELQADTSANAAAAEEKAAGAVIKSLARRRPVRDPYRPICYRPICYRPICYRPICRASGS